MNILIVAAHPDDEVLGCGATMYKHSQRGDKVKVIFLADGESSRFYDETKIKQRHLAAKNANKLLGVEDLVFLDLADNQLDKYPLLEVVQKLDTAVGNFSPEVVYTHFSGDLNVDHQISNRAVLTLFRPTPKQSVKKILAFEVLSSTNWFLGEKNFSPNYFESVEEKSWKLKQAALECYGSEILQYPHARSWEAQDSLAKYRGPLVGLARAEAFELLRQVCH